MSYAKGDLTCDEKLRAAYAYLINGIPQHHIAALYAVNPGRISEAVTATAKALGFPDKRHGLAYTPLIDAVEGGNVVLGHTIDQVGVGRPELASAIEEECSPNVLAIITDILLNDRLTMRSLDNWIRSG